MTRRGIAARVLAPLAALAAAGAPLAGQAGTVNFVGGGWAEGVISWGTGSGPGLVDCSAAAAGHATYDMAVTVQAAGQTYAGPITIRADLVSEQGFCGTAAGGAWLFANATMLGSGPTGTISCDLASTSSGIDDFGSTIAQLGTGFVPCSINGVAVGDLAFSGFGVYTVTGIDTSGRQTSALASDAVYVQTP